MCGVFVLGQMSERMARLPPERMCERQRISNGLLLPYHLGRLTVYAGLGAIGCRFGRDPWAGLRGSEACRRLCWSIAAMLFLTHALGRILPVGVRFDRAPRFWGRLIGAFARRIQRGSAFGEYLLGVALGFLPCGFLYAAIAAAAASARSDLGAASMLAFGLGTTPALMMIGIAGHAAGRRWNRGVTAAAPFLMVLNAVLLLALAWQRLI